MDSPLWTPPDQGKNSTLYHFLQYINHQASLSLQSYHELHHWSVTQPTSFWQHWWQYSQIKFHSAPEAVWEPAARFQDTQWFPGATLNFAANLLTSPAQATALIYAREDGMRRTLSYGELSQQAANLAAHFIACGIKQGDRIAAFLPNGPEAVITLLAASSIGATFSSCSPDFGYEGIFDRFSQIQPTLLVATLTHHYHGKCHRHHEKITRLCHALNIDHVITVNHDQDDTPFSLPHAIDWAAIPTTSAPLPSTPLPFAHPLYIVFSSGTTGQPKCIVHSAGGTLIQHTKEHRLHVNLQPQERLFFYTTTGWMMWNWLISGLASGATLVLYDGSPHFPAIDTLFSLCDEFDIQHFGVGAKLIEQCRSQGCRPNTTHPLKHLTQVLTTGSPLTPDDFDYLYHAVKKEMRVGSISGGTDILSCFALCNPMLPVYRGEIQCLGLGMDVAVFDHHGKPTNQSKGELVCRTPFPSMPVQFLNDPDGKRYQQAYFNVYPNIWAHRDFARLTSHHGLIIYGRSDTTLNPGGVRIGTAEIYRHTDNIDVITDAIAIGHTVNGNESIILFVCLTEDTRLDEKLIQQIKNTIRQGASPHHAPKHIFHVTGVPRTMSGKLTEQAAKLAYLGEPVPNTHALINPECLAQYSQHNPNIRPT